MKVTQFTTDNYGEMRTIFVNPTSSNLTGARTLTIDKEPITNDFLGFGVALTGSSCYNLSQMTKKERGEILEYIYGEDGLNLNVARITVGSSDYSKDIYTYDDIENDVELKYFSVKRDEEYIIPIIKEIIKIKPDLWIFSSPWTPPAWMKSGNSLFGGYMLSDYIETYSEYYLKFLLAYKAQGIKISALTIQNEPDTGQNDVMPQCLFHPELEVKMVKSLSHKIKCAGLDTKIWMFDHCYNGWARVKWQYDTYPELQDISKDIALHYYTHTLNLTKHLFDAYPNLQWHFTEGGPRLYDNYDCDWCKWSSIIIEALNYGCKSFTGWNLMLDQTGGPNVGQFACGGFITRNSLTGELSNSGQLKAYRHFSKYFRGNTKIYKGFIEDDGQPMSIYGEQWLPMYACAFETDDKKHIVEIVNQSKNIKSQLQYNYNGDNWYFELMPNSVSALVFEK